MSAKSERAVVKAAMNWYANVLKGGNAAGWLEYSRRFDALCKACAFHARATAKRRGK